MQLLVGSVSSVRTILRLQWTLDLLSRPLCDIENKRLQNILSRAQNFNFVPNHIAGSKNDVANALSRLCWVISNTEHTPDDTIKLLPMSKKA